MGLVVFGLSGLLVSAILLGYGLVAKALKARQHNLALTSAIISTAVSLGVEAILYAREDLSADPQAAIGVLLLFLSVNALSLIVFGVAYSLLFAFFRNPVNSGKRDA